MFEIAKLHCHLIRSIVLAITVLVALLKLGLHGASLPSERRHPPSYSRRDKIKPDHSPEFLKRFPAVNRVTNLITVLEISSENLQLAFFLSGGASRSLHQLNRGPFAPGLHLRQAHCRFPLSFLEEEAIVSGQGIVFFGPCEAG